MNGGASGSMKCTSRARRLPARWLAGPALALLLLPLAAGCREEPRSLQRPNLVSLAADGRIVVSDFHHQRLVIFDRAGSFLSAFGQKGLGKDELWQVRALLLEGPSRLLLLNQRLPSLTSTGSLWEVKRYEDGHEIAAFPIEVPGAATTEPCGLTASPDGGYLIPDDQLDAILRYDSSFRLTGRWEKPAGGEPFCAPVSILQRGGELWVVEQYCHRIRRLTLDGREIGTIGREGSGPGELLFPVQIDVCPGRWLVVADLGNYRVQRFTLQGEPMDSFSPEPVGPRQPVQLLDLLLTPSCDRLLLVDSKGNRVLITTPEGKVLQTISRW